ncbi:MAG: PAS domain-containing sensor histidine kinase [Patescibacteria group bacterium]|jgi:PAS domain S-box-containing protein
MKKVKKESENEVFDNSSVVEQIITSAHEGIIVYGPDLRYQFWNQYMENLTGKSAGEVLGKHPLEVFPFLREVGIVERLQKVIVGGKVNSIDFSYDDLKTNKRRWSLDSNIALKNKKGEIVGILGTVIDITDRKLMERQWQESEEKYHQVFSTVNDAIVLVDSATGKIIDVNMSFLDLYGYSREEILSMNITDISAEEEKTKDSIAGVITGEVKFVPVRYHKKKNGIIFPVEISSCFFITNGQGVVCGMYRDISEREKVNQMIAEKNKELLKVNEEKDKFFSIIAHDLRSPFGYFLNLTEILVKETLDMKKDEIVEIATGLNNSARGIYILLENLLEWSMINRGVVDCYSEIFSLGQIVKECVELVKGAALIKKIDIENKIDQNFQIYGDQRMLKLVVRNLLSNAIKFTLPGGRVIIRAENSVVMISDSGIGMNKKMVDTLFQFGAKNGRRGTDNETSSGLGLVLCKEYVEKNGGKLWVESEEGKGGTFFFTIKK